MFQGRIQKIQKGMAGTLAHLPTCQLYRYFLEFFLEFYKDNTKFQTKRGGHGPLGPPLNPPSCSSYKSPLVLITTYMV